MSTARRHGTAACVSALALLAFTACTESGATGPTIVGPTPASANPSRREFVPAGILVSGPGDGPLSVVDPVDLTVTELAPAATDGAIAPSRDRFAYTVSDDTGVRIVVVEDGGTSTTEVPVECCPAQLRWSPDGTQLLFAVWQPVGDSGGASDLSILDTGADAPRVVVDGTSFLDPEADLWGVRLDRPRAIHHATWSPTGEQIAWEQHDQTGKRVMIGNPPGDVIAVSEPTETGAPAWSPNGDRIAFNGRDADGSGDTWGPHDIYVADADGTGARALTGQQWYNTTVAWSPTGDQIAFLASPRNGSTALYVTDVADGEVTQLTESAGDGLPVWSPDGSRLAFTGGQLEVMVVAIDGGTPMRTGVTGWPVDWR